MEKDLRRGNFFGIRAVLAVTFASYPGPHDQASGNAKNGPKQ
jgi:hypothetical protein